MAEITWSSTAYLTCVKRTSDSITIQLNGLDTSYAGDSRLVECYVNGVESYGMRFLLENGEDNVQKTITGLSSSTSYTIYVVIYYDTGSVAVGSRGKEEGIRATTYSELGYGINTSVGADKIIVSLDYNEWPYSGSYVDWYISTSETDLFNVNNKFTDIADISLEYECSGLQTNTTYYIGVVIYSDMLVEIESAREYISVKTLSDIPSVKILSIKRTLTNFYITIQNTSSDEFMYELFSNNTYLTSGYGSHVGATLIKSGETVTFEDSFSGGDQYRPYFIYIYSEYNKGESAFFYPNSSSTITVDNKKYGVFRNTSKEDEWTPSYWIKVDVEAEAPWDNKYDTSTSSDVSTKSFMWAPYTGASTVVKPEEHNNVWVSTNYHINNTNSTMVIKFNLKYKSVISFNYLVSSQDTDSYADKLVITLDGESITNFNNSSWKSYSKECVAGSHTLNLQYVKDKSGSSKQDASFFADFKITPTKPTTWDWQTSNYNASATQTKTAHNLVTNGGATSEFSYLVWNDMVDKVKHILDYLAGDYLAGSWNTDKYNYDYEDTLMENTRIGRTLTAKRYNSLRKNVDDLLNGGTGIDEVISKTTPVSGENHFIKLMEKVNERIGLL